MQTKIGRDLWRNTKVIEHWVRLPILRGGLGPAVHRGTGRRGPRWVNLFRLWTRRTVEALWTNYQFLWLLLRLAIATSDWRDAPRLWGHLQSNKYFCVCLARICQCQFSTHKLHFRQVWRSMITQNCFPPIFLISDAHDEKPSSFFFFFLLKPFST